MSRSCLSGRRDDGFTLIEVLVAVALTAVLLTALYAAFFSIYRSTAGVREALTDYIDAGRFLDAFSRDIHSAYMVPGDPLSVFEGGVRGESSYVTFTAFTGPALRGPGLAGGLIKVSYSVEDGKGSARVLREVTNPYTGESYAYEVTGAIRSFDVSYFNGADWVRAWDSALENSAPVAVRATVALPAGEEVFTIARVMIR
ncbi:MAG: prepilin-type N-terminal cleavage/methylation domain-containing protein [Deltaproteobacteria bacterium]|nr:prepilin-type N-terminal cleavage/methylation domain-containing protein [Deltaproteobacteria bacterium]